MRILEKSAEVIVVKKPRNGGGAKDRRSQYRKNVRLMRGKREVDLEQREVTTTVAAPDWYGRPKGAARQAGRTVEQASLTWRLTGQQT